MTHNNSHVLLIDCDDQPGLIYAITKILFKHRFNIINNREFVDEEHNRFYMRTEFDGELGDLKDREALKKELTEVLPPKSRINLPERKKKKVLVFATKEYHCLAELLLENYYQEINFEIQAVISNHEDLKQLVDKFSLPYHLVPKKENQSREEHEAEILKVINEYQPDYLVLAKYMQILSADFVSRFKNQIINIHHSFLPAFVGANPYQQACKRGVKIIGATAHFVTENLDEGPIIVQDTTDVDHSFSQKDMVNAGKNIEKIALVKALKLVLDDRVFVNGNKTVVFG